MAWLTKHGPCQDLAAVKAVHAEIARRAFKLEGAQERADAWAGGRLIYGWPALWFASLVAIGFVFHSLAAAAIWTVLYLGLALWAEVRLRGARNSSWAGPILQGYPERSSEWREAALCALELGTEPRMQALANV